VPDDEFQFDAERHAEWHAEFVSLVTVLLGQFVAIEPRFGRQHGPAIALVVGEPGVVLALVARELQSAIVAWRLRLFRQCGVVLARRNPVRRIACGRRLQRRRFRATPAAAAARLAHTSIRGRLAGQQDFIVWITRRRRRCRRRARHPGRIDT